MLMLETTNDTLDSATRIPYPRHLYPTLSGERLERCGQTTSR